MCPGVGFGFGFSFGFGFGFSFMISTNKNFREPGFIFSARFSPDGQYFAASYYHFVSISVISQFVS